MKINCAKKRLLHVFGFSLITAAHSQAAVVIKVNNVGSDVHMVLTGSFDATGIQAIDPSFTNTKLEIGENGQTFWGENGGVFEIKNAGTWSGNNVIAYGDVVDFGSFSSASDQTFGFDNTWFGWDSSLGTDPGLITPVATWIIPGEDIASIFGTNLDSGKVLLWTSDSGTNDTISIELVPEPSSVSLLGIASLAGILRRKRK